MKKRLVSLVAFLAYSALLVKVMVFKDIPTIRVGQLMLNFGGTDGGHPANFVPFATIGPYLMGKNGLIIAGINLVGNIILLVPLGFLLPLVLPNISWRKSFFFAAGFGLAIETMQTILHVGIFDIDDVLLNALGFMIGYFAFRILSKWMMQRNWLAIAVAAVAVCAAVLGAFYVVYPWGRPVNPGTDVDAGISQNKEGAMPQSGDLCGGTGGTGEIVSKEENSISIKSKAGVTQTILLTQNTEIKNSSGAISASALQVGDHVTVVIMGEDKTATAVLVCSPLE